MRGVVTARTVSGEETHVNFQPISPMSEINKPEQMIADGRFRLVFEHSPIGMAMVGTDYSLQKVNASLCEALGYTEAELLSRTFVEITHPDDVKKDRELADKLFRGEIPSYRLQKRFLTKDGRLVWLDLSAFVIRGVQDEPTFGLAMVENITERKRAEEALRTSEERYRSFVVNSSEAIWRFEMQEPLEIKLPLAAQIDWLYQNAYLAECNDAMARLYGHDRAEDVIGAPIGDFISRSNPINLASVTTFLTNNYRLHNRRSIASDGDGVERHFSNSVIGFVVNGFLLRLWGTQRDETDRRIAENKLQRSREQLRSLAAHLQDLREIERADLARDLHDVFGQSLTSLKIDLTQIRKRIGAPDPEMAKRFDSSSELIEKTIAQVKTLSTELRPGVLDKFGLAAAVEWQCQEFQNRTGINCDCQLPAADAQFSAEHSIALFRILQEALSNVARHSGAASASVVLSADESDAVLSVRDDGKGITAAAIAAPDSLGLLGMRERAETLHGQLTVEGRPGSTLLNARIPIKAPRES